jgi:protein SCO1/2
MKYRRLSSAIILVGQALACAGLQSRLLAQVNSLPRELEGVGITEKLDQRVDLNLEFINESGQVVPLRNFFNGRKPVLLDLVYYNCPMLCNLVLNAQTATMREVPWTPGEEYEIVTISIDPRETRELAARKKAAHIESYGKPVHGGWHFLTDYNGNVERIAQQVGFRYRWDEPTQQYAHAAAIMFLTPDGRVSRYLYGIKYNPRDLRLALTEAAEGKVGSAIDKLLLFCFHYDPSARSYVPFAMNIMRLGAALTVGILVIVLLRFWRRERRMARNLLVTAE